MLTSLIISKLVGGVSLVSLVSGSHGAAAVVVVVVAAHTIF